LDAAGGDGRRKRIELTDAGRQAIVGSSVLDAVVKDPLFRFLSRFVFGHTSTMETYLDALARAPA
jgi:hypothetical protein